MQSIHENIVLQHAKNLSLEEILINCLKNLYSSEDLPDNPYPTIYKTVRYYNVIRSLEEQKNKVEEQFTRNEMVDEGIYGITTVMGLYNVFGIKNVLEIVHPTSINNLIKVLRPYIIDKSESLGDVKFDIFHAVSGGYLFRNNIFEVAEVATSPLKIYAIYQPSVAARSIGINFFIDYIFDDVLAMSRVDQEFNLFKHFEISSKDTKSGNTLRKTFTLEEIINGKNSFYTEVRDAIENRQKICLKIWLRIKNLDNVSQQTTTNKVQQVQVPRTSYGSASSLIQNMTVNEDNFIYVNTEKVYILHLIERKQQNKSFTSFSHSPLCALLDGVFQTRETAQNYTSFYISKEQNPVDKNRLNLYLEDKYFTIFENYQKGNIGHCLYETLLTVLLESDNVRKQIVNGILVILSMPACKLYGLCSIVQVLQKLLSAYLDYKFPQFKKSLENQFHLFYKKLQEVLALGFSSEIIAFRKYLDILIDSISGEGNKELEIDNTTMETLKNIEMILKTISLSELNYISTSYKLTKSAIDLVVNKYGSQLNPNFVSPDQYEIKKHIDRVCKIEKEREKNKTQKLYPTSDQDQHIYSQYTVDTFIQESLFYLLRDQFTNPQYPNSLAIACLKLQSHLVRFDLYGGIPDSYIKENEINKPFQNPNPPQNLYILGTTDMKERQIPFSISDYYTLTICSSLDVGLFRKFFKLYDFDLINIGDMFTGGYLKILTSITGYSIFNKFQRIKKQTSMWTLMYDIVITGASFEAAIPSYIALLLKYAIFLHKQTDAVLLGFYAQDEPENAAVTIFQISNENDLKEASRKMYEFIKARVRLYMKCLLPIESNYKKCNIYFNMHFKSDDKTTTYSTLYPVNTIHDVAKIFFQIEDFEEWDLILRSHPLFSPTDHLIDEYKNAYLSFRFLDAFKCLIILKVLDERHDQIFHFLRILYSQAETFSFIMTDLQIVRDLIKDMQRCQLHKLMIRKVTIDKLYQYFMNIKLTIINEIQDSHLIVIENYQYKVLNSLNEIELLMKSTTQTDILPNRLLKICDKMQKKLKRIELIIKLISNCIMSYASEYMKSTYSINVFDDPLTID